MSTRREFEQRYASFWRSLANFLRKSSGFPVSRVAREGSRRKGTHKDRSDLDVIFAISGNPQKLDVYPLLIQRLIPTMNLQAKIGTGNNAIKIQKDQIKCDLVLLTESQFQKQIDNRKFEQI